MIAQNHIRHLVCIPDQTQRYWSLPRPPVISKFKRDILMSPILGTRHNREFRIGTATNVGTLPTRFQALFLLALFGGNLVLCVFSIHWSQPSAVVLSEIR